MQIRDNIVTVFRWERFASAQKFRAPGPHIVPTLCVGTWVGRSASTGAAGAAAGMLPRGAWEQEDQEMACRDASFRRKPESSVGEWQSTVCTEQLQNTKQIAL